MSKSPLTTRRILTSSLYLILLGQFLLFITYLTVGRLPSAITMLNIAIVALILIGLGAQFFAADQNRVDQFYRFCGSGLFFMLLGILFIFVAQWSMGIAHAGITFVLVVLGVAVLLYGTGTQGLGELQTDTSTTKYNVAIAGGAGVMAFCVALGIIWYSPKMRDAFQTEKKFVRVVIKSADGTTSIPSYVPLFDIDGVAIPAARRGNAIEVLVPYFSSELATRDSSPENSQDDALKAPPSFICPDDVNLAAWKKLHETARAKTISATFFRVTPNDTLKSTANATFRIRLDQSMFSTGDGGTDYPLYPVQMCVSLQAPAPLHAVIGQAGNSLAAAPNRKQPRDVPNLIFNQVGIQ